MFEISNATPTSTQTLKAQQLSHLYATNILVKGGHGNKDTLTDTLYADGNTVHFEHRKIDTKNTHGTGCTLSSAICANIAKGNDLTKATEIAINFTQKCVKGARLLNVGKSYGPVNHLIYSD